MVRFFGTSLSFFFLLFPCSALSDNELALLREVLGVAAAEALPDGVLGCNKV